MIRKLLLLAAALVVGLATPAAAGGWATTALDDAPTGLIAGQDRRVGFTILQHGRTPVNPDSGDIGIRLVEATSGESLWFPAVPEGPTGHYAAIVNVPRAGTWQWEVHQGWFAPQELGTLEVAPANTAATSTGGGGVDGWRVAAIVIAGLLAVTVAIELVLGRRQRAGERGERRPAPEPVAAPPPTTAEA